MKNRWVLCFKRTQKWNLNCPEQWGLGRLQVEWSLAIFNMSLDHAEQSLFCWTEPQSKECHLPEVTPVENIILNVLVLQGIYSIFLKLFSASPSNRTRRSAMHQSFPITLGTCRQLSTNLWQQPGNLWRGVALGVGFSFYLLLFLQKVGLQQLCYLGPDSPNRCAITSCDEQAPWTKLLLLLGR